MSSLGRCPEHMQLKVTLKQTQDRMDLICHLKLCGVPPLLFRINNTFVFSAKQDFFRGSISHHMNTLDSFLLFRQPK